MEVLAKTIDRESPEFKIAQAIDNLRSALEDHADELREAWARSEEDVDESPIWNAQDAAALLEQAVTLLDPNP